jgi:hypothetical protein
LAGIRKDAKIKKQVKTEKKLYEGDRQKMSESEGAIATAAGPAALPAAAAPKLNQAPAAEPALAQRATKL